jgi:hypothetical protein
MKIIVAILASDNDCYPEFKKIWINQIINLIIENDLCDLYDFYFLYSDNQKSKQIEKVLYSDYCDSTPYNNRIESFLIRTINFFDFILPKYKDEKTFFIRTNLSTVFDFKILTRWMKLIPFKQFLGGIYIDNINPIISGTGIIMSRDIVKFLTVNKNFINYSKYIDDVFISNFICANNDVVSLNISRIEIVVAEGSSDKEPAIYFKNCKIHDDYVFSFRFKTNDRQKDVEMMKFFTDEMWKTNNFDILTKMLKKFNMKGYCFYHEEYDKIRRLYRYYRV